MPDWNYPGLTFLILVTMLVLLILHIFVKGFGVN